MTARPSEASDGDATAWDEGDATAARDRLATAAALLPGVERRDEAGHTGWLVRGRRFAWLLVDHHGDGRLALCVRAPDGEQEALVTGDPRRWFVPAYLGRHGWVGLRLDPAAHPDWDEAEALLDQAWRLSAGPRAVARRDAAEADRRLDAADGAAPHR